ncbi:hypothetical protein JCM8097_003366 [Rhodosporidiobolus ruineniae]
MDVQLVLTVEGSVDGKPLKQLSVTQGAVTFGRAPRDDPAAHDPTTGKFRSNGCKVMSSKHSRLTWEGSHALLQDLDSTNGTYVRRDGETRRLGKGVQYRINSGDVITFGRQVDHNDLLVKPVSLVASYSTKPFYKDAPPVHKPSTSAASAPLARGGTITSRTDVNESALPPSSFFRAGAALEDPGSHARPPKASQQPSKRRGYGPPEDSAVDTQDEDEAADVTLDLEQPSLVPPRRVDSAFEKESTASVAAASTRSLWGSPVPPSHTSTRIDPAELPAAEPLPPDFGSPDFEATQAVNEGMDLDNVDDEPKYQDAHPDLRFRLPSPVSPEQASSRLPPLAAESTSSQQSLAELLKACTARSKEASRADSPVEEEGDTQLVPPTGLFSQPTGLSRRPKAQDLMFDEEEQASSHLPSPVSSHKEDESEDEFVAAVDAEAEARPTLAESLKKLDDLVRNLHQKADSVAHAHSTAASAGSAAIERSSTPVGRGFSPPTTSSPLSNSLNAYLAEQDEHDRLVHQAESVLPEQHQEEDYPPSSSFEEDSNGFAMLLDESAMLAPTTKKQQTVTFRLESSEDEPIQSSADLAARFDMPPSKQYGSGSSSRIDRSEARQVDDRSSNVDSPELIPSDSEPESDFGRNDDVPVFTARTSRITRPSLTASALKDSGVFAGSDEDEPIKRAEIRRIAIADSDVEQDEAEPSSPSGFAGSDSEESVIGVASPEAEVHVPMSDGEVKEVEEEEEDEAEESEEEEDEESDDGHILPPSANSSRATSMDVESVVESEADLVDDPIQPADSSSDMEQETEQESLRGLDETDERDPDLDEVDLDVDGSVAHDLDTDVESDEVDDRDGMGIEEEKWVDGVSENLREEEEEEVEKVKPEEDEDDGYTSEGVACPPHAIFAPVETPDLLNKDKQTRALHTPGSPSTPSTLEGSLASSSNRKRRLSETDIDADTPPTKLAIVAVLDHQTASAVATTPVENVQPTAAATAGAQPVTPAVPPAPKRRRLGFSVKTFAAGVLTGMVAAVGGLSALGAMLEEE